MFLDAVKSVARPFYRPFTRYVRQHPRRFRRQMDRYFETHCTVLPPNTDEPNLRALIENGFVLLRGYHDRELVRRVHDATLPLLERVKNGDVPAEWRTINYSEDGIYRLRDVGQHIPEAAPILNDAYLRSLVDGYFKHGPVRAKSDYVDYKPDVKHDYTSVLHMDSFQSQVKIFTLLSDVTERTAPMVYWSKSHRDGEWRRRFDYLYWLGDPVGTHGHVPVTPLREMRDRGGPGAPQEHVITGPAGTVLIADTRGIHRASCLVEGYRLEIVQKFSL
jgi:hypothetical protein